MRSGLRKSRTAWPSRRNSGFDATVTPSPATPASDEHPLHEAGRTDRHRRLVDDDGVRREHRRDLAGDGLDVTRGRPRRRRPAGVCTQRKTIVGAAGARRRRRRTRSRRDASPSAMQLGQAGLEDRAPRPSAAARPAPRRCRRTRRRVRDGRSTPPSSARRIPAPMTATLTSAARESS